MLTGLLTHVLYSFDEIIQLMISAGFFSCEATKYIFFPIRMAKNKPRLANPPEIKVNVGTMVHAISTNLFTAAEFSE